MNFKIVILAFCCIAVFSCMKEEVSNSIFTLPEGDVPELVVHGAVLSVYGKQFVRLSLPKSNEYADSILPVSDAIITLFDGEKYYPYQESTIPGEYFTVDSVLLEAGNVYT